MNKSNVIVKNNIHVIKTEDPRLDKEFISDIRDYDKLKEIKEERKVNHNIPNLTQDQEKIIANELRCVYAKNDPCFGYVEKEHKVVCKCINGLCPNITKCNPEYTEQYAKEWMMNNEEQQLYGDPTKLKKYYLTDLFSDKERQNYELESINYSRKFPVPSDFSPEEENENLMVNREKFRIDPNTGKRQYVIGYESKITDNASYESDARIPIWGSLDEYLENPLIRKSKIFIKKKKSTKSKFEQIELAEISKDDLLKIARDKDDLDIIVDNPAEQAFISSLLIDKEIDHGINIDSKIRILLKNKLEKFPKNHIGVISSQAINHNEIEEMAEWRYLKSYDKLFKLIYPKRNFYNFKYKTDQNRWCSINDCYGVLQVCIKESDIQEISIEPGICLPVILKENGNSYNILNKMTGLIIGKMNNQISELMKCLKEKYLINEIPEEIDGIYIKTEGSITDILGIGKLVTY